MDKLTEAIRLLEAGKPPTYVAKVLGISPTKLSEMFRKAGLPRPYWFIKQARIARLKQGATKRQLMEEFHLTEARTRRFIKEVKKCFL